MPIKRCANFTHGPAAVGDRARHVSLDGDAWRFKLYGAPEDVPADAAGVEFDDKDFVNVSC